MMRIGYLVARGNMLIELCVGLGVFPRSAFIGVAWVIRGFEKIFRWNSLMAYEVARLLFKIHLREWSRDRSLGASTQLPPVALPTNVRLVITLSLT